MKSPESSICFQHRINLIYLLPRSELVDHALDFRTRRAGCFGAQAFKCMDILNLLRFLARLDDHTAFDPHLDSIGHGKVGAFGHEERGKLRISCAKDFVIKRLLSLGSAGVHVA